MRRFQPSFTGASNSVSSIHVDSEPKVLQALTEPGSILNTFIRPGNVLSTASGRGNNWAMGHYLPDRPSILHKTKDVKLSGGTKKQGWIPPSANESGTGVSELRAPLAEATMEAFRKEVERLDAFQGTLVWQSLGGGTGSGTGSRLVEMLREAYPMRYIASVALAPFASGDTPLQAYNTALSLSTLTQVADAVWLFRNDDVMRALTKGAGAKSRARIGLSDMNAVIASTMAGVLRPISGVDFDLGDFVTTLAPMPSARFLESWTSPYEAGSGGSSGSSSSSPAVTPRTMRAAVAALSGPQATPQRRGSPMPLHGPSLGTSSASGGRSIRSFSRSWAVLAETLQSVVPGYGGATALSLGDARAAHIPQSLTAQVVARGWKKEERQDRFSAAVERVTKNIVRPVAWNYEHAVDVRKCRGGQSSLTLTMNRSSVVPYLDGLVARGRAKARVGAFCHWYAKFGIDREALEESFRVLEDVAQTYEDLTSP